VTNSSLKIVNDLVTTGLQVEIDEMARRTLEITFFQVVHGFAAKHERREATVPGGPSHRISRIQKTFQATITQRRTRIQHAHIPLSIETIQPKQSTHIYHLSFLVIETIQSETAWKWLHRLVLFSSKGGIIS
jgi:hypothetical protein